MSYIRPCNYHETDKMGIIHHSNYIKYLEEARVYELLKMKVDYKKLEADGYASPVLEVKIKYLKNLQFGNLVRIETKFVSYNSIKFNVEYNLYNHETNELVSTASSSHCFIDLNGKVISLKRIKHPYHKILDQTINNISD